MERKSLNLLKKVLTIVTALSMLNSLCFIASCLNASADGGITNYFNDVKPGAWYYEDAMYAYNNGFMRGTSDATFEPETVLTRAMMATTLYRMAGEPEVPSDDASDKTVFLDIDPAKNFWYSDAVCWAGSTGLIKGLDDGKGGIIFDPEFEAPRAQFATLLYRYTEYAGIKLPEIREYVSFEDSVPEWAKESVEKLYKAGIIEGKPGNVFEPYEPVTRAQTAALIRRITTLQ